MREGSQHQPQPTCPCTNVHACVHACKHILTHAKHALICISTTHVWKWVKNEPLAISSLQVRIHPMIGGSCAGSCLQGQDTSAECHNRVSEVSSPGHLCLMDRGAVGFQGRSPAVTLARGRSGCNSPGCLSPSLQI